MVGLYVRSGEKPSKSELSTRMQLAILDQYRRKNEIGDFTVYEDEGVSGRIVDRPALNELLHDCKLRKINAVIVTSFDRLAESLSAYHVIQEQFDLYHVTWKSTMDKLDASTETGRLRIKIKLDSIRESQQNRMKTPKKQTMEHYKETDDKQYRLPAGLRWDNGEVVKDNSCSDKLETMFRERLAGKSLNAIQRITGWDKGTIGRRLKNSSYVGIYITEEQYREIVSNPKAVKYDRTDRVYLFAGLVRCGGCGGPMTPSFVHSMRDGIEYGIPQYCCSRAKTSNSHCVCPRIAESLLEKASLDALDGKLSQYYADVALSPILPSHTKVDDYRQKKVALCTELGGLELSLKDGEISSEDYNVKTATAREELKSVPNEVPCRMPEDWKDMYNTLSMDEKRVFWHKILGCLMVHKDKSIPVEVYF